LPRILRGNFCFSAKLQSLFEKAEKIPLVTGKNYGCGEQYLLRIKDGARGRLSNAERGRSPQYGSKESKK